MKKQEMMKELSHIKCGLSNLTTGKGFVASPEIHKFCDILTDLEIKFTHEGVDPEIVKLENGKEECGFCGGNVSIRRVTLAKTMIFGLIKAFNFVMENKRQTFFISDLNTTNSEYARMNDLVRFGLLYKSKDFDHGEYGVPRKTVSKFLHGEWRVAQYFDDDPTKKEGDPEKRTMSENRILITEVPKYRDLQEEFGNTITQYFHNEDFE